MQVVTSYEDAISSEVTSPEVVTRSEVVTSPEVVTNSKGEPQFNFDQWIQENGLSDIKHIFQRHGAVTPDKLTMTSKEFNAGVMVDPELFTTNSSLIPQIMQAMRCSKQRVVITEVEDIAMDKAGKEHEKIMEDVHKFEKMIRNTNANHVETQKLITEKFKEIVDLLKEREKQLMTELEEVRSTKTDLFEKQLIVLKEYNEKYNDVTHQWDESLTAPDIDRSERQKNIKEASDGLVAEAQNLREEYKHMFDDIGDQFMIRFGESQQVLCPEYLRFDFVGVMCHQYVIMCFVCSLSLNLVAY